MLSRSFARRRPRSLRPRAGRRRGVVSVLAILMLAIFFTLAVSYTTMTTFNETLAYNQARAEVARFQAESGVSFVLRNLSSVPVPAGAGGTTLLNAIAASLAAQLDGTPNLNGAAVTNSGGVVTIPLIATDGNTRGFRATLTVESASVIRVSVTGVNGPASRTIHICLNAAAAHNGVFDFGVAARGPISLIGNTSIRGANNRQEGSVLTVASGPGNEVTINGNCTIDGNVSMGPGDGNAALTGNVSIGGSGTGNDWAHINLGVGDMTFPTMDPNVFAPFATNTVNSSTATTGNLPFTNIRIAAGTNPTFAGNITIKGIVYVESPNVVTFTGNLNFTGILVTQNAGSGATAANKVKFNGNTTSAGVEALPDTSDFHDLRQMPGTFILAPGFEVGFLGNFGTVNGCMAAEKFSFMGNAGGTVYGGVMSYGPDPLSLAGNSTLIINRSRYTGDPPGFVPSAGGLVPNMDSYEEK